MEEITLYKCEICGTEYKEKSRCQQCEKTHRTKANIIKMKYRPYSADESGYPDRIIVKFEDGIEKIYKR